MVYVLFIFIFIIHTNYSQNFMGLPLNNTKNYKITVNKIEFNKKIGNALFTKKADGVYLLVYISIKNTRQESRILSSSMFKVADKNNYIYDISDDALNALVLSEPEKVFLLKKIPPNIPKEIIIPFEVPSENENYVLLVEDSYNYEGIEFCPLFYKKPPKDIQKFIRSFNTAIKEKSETRLANFFCKEGLEINSYGTRSDCGSLIKGEKEVIEYLKIFIQNIWEYDQKYKLISEQFNRIEYSKESYDSFYECFKIKLKYDSILEIWTYNELSSPMTYYLRKLNDNWEIFSIYNHN